MSAQRKFVLCLWLIGALPLINGTSASGADAKQQSALSTETVVSRAPPDSHIPRNLVYAKGRILGSIGLDAYIWDARTGRVLQKFVGHRDDIQDVRLSPDGRFLLTSTGIMEYGDLLNVTPEKWPKEICTRLWSVETGEQLWALPGQFAAALSPDGRRLLTFSLLHPYGEASGLSIWDIASKRKIAEARPVACKDCLPVDATSSTVAFSPDSHSFMSLNNSGRATLWDASDGREIGVIDRNVETFHYYGTKGAVASSSDEAVERWSADLHPAGRVSLAEGLPVPDFGSLVPWTSGGRLFVGLRWHRAGGRDYIQVCDLELFRIYTYEAPLADGKILMDPGSERALFYEGELQVGEIGDGRHPLKLVMFALRGGHKLWKVDINDLHLVGFAPDGGSFLAQGSGNMITIYSSDTGRLVRKFDLREK